MPTTQSAEFATAIEPFMQVLGKELMVTDHLSFEDLLTEEGQEQYADLRSDSNYDINEDPFNESSIGTGNLSDKPTEKDALSRKALARYLAHRIRHIYDRDIDQGKTGSFLIQLDGAWGSGKSTLLGFLRRELCEKSLEPSTSKSHLPWIVVDFNAWEAQRLDPPWWYLMKSVAEEIRRSLWSRKPGRALYIMLREILWRINTGTNYLIAALVTLLLFCLALYVNRDRAPEIDVMMSTH